MQWGAARVCALLEVSCTRWGLPATAGGALMGLATASPEISVNLASVGFGWPDLGLGAALGSNVPALPLIFVLSYVSTRFAERRDAQTQPVAANTASTEEPPPPRVQPQAVEVQVIPYLLVVCLLAAITLPPAWAGLQPIDALILVVAFGVYFLRAISRKRTDAGRSVSTAAAPSGAAPGGSGPGGGRGGVTRALIGVPAIALGSLASVIGARHIDQALGISDLVGGLFIIGLLCALPESFAAWTLAREGKTTTAVSTATADGIVSLTLALVPPALVGSAVGNLTIYLVNLVFLAAVLVTYIVLNHRSRGQELGLGRVSVYGLGYGAYVAATVFVLAR